MTMAQKKKTPEISAAQWYDKSHCLLRNINTNTNTYLIFFTCGVILLIVGALLVANLGVDYSSTPLRKNARENSNVVLTHAGTAAFILGGMSVGFPIIITIYVALQLRRSPLLKENISPKIFVALVFGIFLQIPAFIGFIVLHKQIKRLYFKLSTTASTKSPAPPLGYSGATRLIY